MDGAGGLGLFCYFSALLGVCIKKSVDEKECTVRKPVFFLPDAVQRAEQSD